MSVNCLYQKEMTAKDQGFKYHVVVFLFVFTLMVDTRYMLSASPTSARLCCCEMSFCLDLLREMVWSKGSDAAADYTEIRRLTSNLPSVVWGSVSQLE